MYQTLASVAGAPQVALSCASSASVVASVVLMTWLKPSAAAVAPPIVSLPGAAANAGWTPKAEARTSAPTLAINRRTRMEPPTLGASRGPRTGPISPTFPAPAWLPGRRSTENLAAQKSLSISGATWKYEEAKSHRNLSVLFTLRPLPRPHTGAGRSSHGRAEGSVLLTSFGSGDDLLDDGRLGVGVVLDVIPLSGAASSPFVR